MSDLAMWDAIKSLEESHAALDSKFERLMQHFVTMDERVTDFMVDCQQQSIAALEAKVDQMNPNDEGLHTLPEETPAHQRYREAKERHYSNREVEMAAGAFDRAEEVAQDLDDWTHLIHMGMNTTSRRLAALESPAAAPDPAPLDPVLVAEVADILRHAAIQSLDCHSTAECVVVAIRAYGRDGAR